MGGRKDNWNREKREAYRCCLDQGLERRSPARKRRLVLGSSVGRARGWHTFALLSLVWRRVDGPSVADITIMVFAAVTEYVWLCGIRWRIPATCYQQAEQEGP